MTYYAKTGIGGAPGATVKQHLTEVRDKAREYGSFFGRGGEAAVCGQFHDFGKYSERFQDVLKGTASGIDHAICGGAELLAYSHCTDKCNYVPIIEAICAHHSCLKDFSELDMLCRSVYTKDNVEDNGEGKRPALSGAAEFRSAEQALKEDFENPEHVGIRKMPGFGNDGVARMLYTRMLLSCLVDADYTASAEEDGDVLPPDMPVMAEDWLKRLLEHVEKLGKSSSADAGLKEIRNMVFNVCGRAGVPDEALYTLTAPTGTGKTLALMHFALRQCLEGGKRRIIIVLPYLTLTDQNAAVYREILGAENVLEDHSQAKLDENARILTARWNAPVIITTSVRFFESLFAACPGDVRRLHNIADSVVVFDEAQSLPVDVTTATLKAVNELCKHYRVTMLFSTATQPYYSALPDVKWAPKEIMGEEADLYRKLARVDIKWRVRHEERVPLCDIAGEMAGRKSVCCIINLKRHAAEVYSALKGLCDADSLFYITTDLCPEHRMQVVKAVRARLDAGLECRVVATQCIEAGVDLDFDCVYRALAPLDSIIQAAGRCNRNGRLRRGEVVVFEPLEERNSYPDDWYRNAAVLVRRLQLEKPIDINNPEDIKHYYVELFKSATDREELTGSIRTHNYEKTAENYKLIPQRGVRVIVPFEGMRKLFDSLYDEALKTGVTADFMRRCAPITVTVYRSDTIAEFAEELYVRRRRGDNYDVPSGFYIVRPQCHDIYRQDTGLTLKTQNDGGIMA